MLKQVRTEPDTRIKQLQQAIELLRRELEAAVQGVEAKPDASAVCGAPDTGIFKLHDLIAEVAAEFPPTAQRPLRIRTAASQVWVRADRKAIEQVVRRLMSNAVSHTLKGGVLIGCRRRSGKINVEVWDTGLGVDQSNLIELQNAPNRHRLDKALQDLAAARSGCEAIGASFRVRSRLGRGSVAVIAGIEAAETPVGMAPTASVPEGRLILVIADDQAKRRMLGEEGRWIITAADPGAAADLIRRLNLVSEVLMVDQTGEPVHDVLSVRAPADTGAALPRAAPAAAEWPAARSLSAPVDAEPLGGRAGFDRLAAANAGPISSNSQKLAGLTHRQREILDLVLDGYPSKKIAGALHISQRTVENHRSAIMKRSGARSLPELTRIAIQEGLERMQS